MKIKKIVDRLKTNPYLGYKQKTILVDHVLLEGGQGKNINGNMFSMVRELSECEEYQQYKIIYVVTKATQQEANKRFAFYGYKVTLVVRDSLKYKMYLARCKYLLNDNSFPPYFSKREEQVYMNTWHGTPLKTLGKRDLNNAKSFANIQKNYLMSDYALFPNKFTANVFMKDYQLEKLYTGTQIMASYPRNRVFLDRKFSKEIRKNLGFEDKELIAYMPTWRGNQHHADSQVQKAILENYFDEIDKKLSDRQIFYVNLHFLANNTIDYTNYEHIKPFPEEYETYDFLANCDMLITDYSSVLFDYVSTKRKIILFAYDEENYEKERGLYFSLQSLPFPIVRTVDELMRMINKRALYPYYEEFLETYVPYRDHTVAKKLLTLLFEGSSKGLDIQSSPNKQKDMLFVYGGKLRNIKLNKLLQDYLKDAVLQHPKDNVVLGFRGKLNQQTMEFLKDLPEGVSYYALVNKFEFPFKEKVIFALTMRSMYFAKKMATHDKKFYDEERARLLYHFDPKKVVYFAGNPNYMYRILSMFSCETEAHIHHNNVAGVIVRRTSYQIMCKYVNKYYAKVVDHRFDDVRSLWSEDKEAYYNKCLKIGNVSYLLTNRRKGLHLSALCYAHTVLPFSLKNLKVKVAGHMYDAHVREGFHIGRGVRLTHLSLTIPYKDITEFSMHNKVELCFSDHEGYGIHKGIMFCYSHKRKGKNHRGPIHIFEQTQTATYFRQSARNFLYVTVRKQNTSDAWKEQLKLNVAYYLAKVVPLPKVILLYEKESSRYEESASLVYETLVDSGYKHAYFILDQKYAQLHPIDEKYKANLLYKTSFKHYFMFFKSKTFIGTESMVHAIDLRIANRCALKKLAKKNIDYVFLQHGVMYMVSLDSEARKFFKVKSTKGKYRVVVSSKKEVQHFIELGNYQPEHLYLSGLPKFDRNVWNEDADKITIMPTWRPWEYNEIRYDVAKTKYYQMLLRIVHSIAEEDREKVVILPHPLIANAIEKSDVELQTYIHMDEKYDDILKQTKVLITDYSSIAYDAFYRGSNIIFYWEEKDACIKEYGNTTKLLLNEDNAFGDICYNTQQLQQMLTKNLHQEQTALYKERYHEFMPFQDGNNTQRLIEFMKKDNII